MRTRVPILAALLGICPAVASACSLCFESAVLEWSWWTKASGFLALGLLVEMIVSGVVARVLKVPIVGGARWLIGGIVLGLFMAIVGFGMTAGFALFFSICMSVRMVRSVREMKGVHPRFALARVGLVVVIVAVGLVASRPGAKSTEWLVRRVANPLQYKSVPAHLAPANWMERELVSRPAVADRLLARLRRLEPGASEYSRERGTILRLLRVHAMVERDGLARHAECERLGVTPEWSELLRSMNATVVCGSPSQDVARIGDTS